VAILALLPPWILIVLVTGRRGLRGAWPLALVGSFAYILGQYPTSQYLGPYLPDVIGAVVCFGALLLLLRFWRPRETLGFGDVVIDPADARAVQDEEAGTVPGSREVIRGFMPFVILIVVVAANGP
jgi:lactate permease